MLKAKILLLVGALLPLAMAGEKCVWARGKVLCERNATKQLNAEVRLLDKDGDWVFQTIDPDDSMGVTFANEDGSFTVEGCGYDRDWLPFVTNDPEPYIQIRHNCNTDDGETLILPGFKTFVPDTYEAGTIKLDA
uniref:Uncharacterized protein n=1 Tax=Plectus sambesii TaxID=2011161 RepID=A0A914W1D9_9BILA